VKHFLKLIGIRFGLVLMLAAVPAANAAIIYSDLNLNGGWGVPSRNGEMGDQITVAGSERFVTRLSIEIYSQGGPFPNPVGIPPGFADFQAQIYANEGFQGEPGTLLWQSSITHVNYQPGLTLLDFDPQLLVPDTFTWTLAYYNPSPIPPALPSTLAPTIGGNAGFYWFRGQNTPWGRGSGGYDWAAQVEAVPEAGVGALLLTIFAVLHLLRKKSSATTAG
jgi:hypothetical protein